MHEKNWCQEITFNYNYENTDLSTISFCIGPMKFNGQIIRNSIKDQNNTTFQIPMLSDNELLESNNFFIFIDDTNHIGQCFLVLKSKIYKYKETHPKINSNYILVDKKFIYDNCLWSSGIPKNEDRLLLYPEDYLKNNI